MLLLITPVTLRLIKVALKSHSFYNPPCSPPQPGLAAQPNDHPVVVLSRVFFINCVIL